MSDVIDDIPVIVPAQPTVDWISTVPIRAMNDVAMILANTRDVDNEMVVHAGCRIPAHWAVLIDQIRDAPGTRHREIWKTKSDFYRWSVALGLLHARELVDMINNPDVAVLDEDLSAQIFLSQMNGRLSARVQIVSDTASIIEKMSPAIKSLMSTGNYTSAAELITEWFNEAMTMPDIEWREFLIRSFMRDEGIRGAVSYLIKNNIIDNEGLGDWAEQDGILDASTEELEKYYEEKHL